MKTREEVLQILKKVLPGLRGRYAIGEILLFGSYSRGEQTVTSDVDLAVEYTGSMTYRQQIALQEELSAALGLRVDLADRGALKKRIKDRVDVEAVAV